MNFDEFYDKELIYPLNGSASTKVYKAKYKGEVVAVKVFGMKGREDMNLLRREIVTLHESQHDHVVKFIGASISPHAFIAMEFIPTTLEVLLKESKKNKESLELNLAVHIALSISQAMRYVHGKEIIHRDLKPGNILLTCDNPPKVKVADFGLSRKVDPCEMMTPFRGTFRYMAPEIHDTVSELVTADKKVDVFSFSMILWELLSSSELLPGDPFAAHTESRTMGKRPPLDEIPVDFRPLLQTCWSHTPTGRPDFTAIIDMLSTISAPDAGL